MKITAATKTNIIIPREATEREVFAADELCSYLKKITGARIEIITDDSEHTGNAIIIGGPERNAAAARYISKPEFDKAVPGPEGMMIKTFGSETLLIAGSSENPNECERGTIYAVYELLERFLGCSLSAYINPEVSGGEHIPVLDEIKLDGIEYIKPSADIKYRTAIVQYANLIADPDHAFNITFLDWLCKNRYNRILTWSKVYEKYKENGMLREAERRGIRFTVGHHESSRLFLPPEGNSYFPERYYETHPEYYKLMEDGKRFRPENFWGQWIFCSRNDDLIREISNNVISWIAQNPSVDIIAFWPQDGMDKQCVCEKCSEYSKVANYTFFQNELAKRVSEVYPNVKIDMLIYTDLWEYPEGLKLEPCLIVDEATWSKDGLRAAGKPDGTGFIDTYFEKNLLQWHGAGAEAVIYDYYMGVYPARQRYIPMADEIASIFKRFSETGVMGSGTQIECFNMWNHIFNFYTFARTAYDTSLTLEDCLNSFTRIFGAGAMYISEIIREAEACLDGQTDIMHAGLYLMDHIDKKKIYALYEKALNAAESPAHRNNIRMMRMVFRYSDLETSEETARDMENYKAFKEYEDPTGELYYISSFDSYKYNNPGYGIAVPVDCSDKGFKPDKWYMFEKNKSH